MLELRNITKEYTTGNVTVPALKGINLSFRRNEFVSILGQSGSGKTTLLNIVGGLDRYSAGDLVINGKSTKDFKDKDWDTYRNHSVGFIFQSYNLIPHQSVVANVELALTLSGVGKQERRERALDVLKRVGLEDHVYKRPNQLSGGQMQRVAIARALINDPEILLADEPTGALDTETSLQVMALLKEIAQDRLVIMVTHNPELAEEYSTRIINLRDGQVINDNDPFGGEEVDRGSMMAKGQKMFMSFSTALALSFNNLLTKKGRTFLTAFAGSIGIIGIALILSLSTGVQRYISRIEEDTLSSYPIVIEESNLDISMIMEALIGMDEEEVADPEEGQITTQPMMEGVMDTLASKQDSNNLAAFKEFLESGDPRVEEYANAIRYGYSLPLYVYNENGTDGVMQVNPSQVMESLSAGMGQRAPFPGGPAAAFGGGSNDVWQELLDNRQLLQGQYDTLAGRWPEDGNEVVLLVDEQNQVSDYMLYALGLLSQEQLADNFEALLNDEELVQPERKAYTFEDFIGMTFKLVLNSALYEKNGNVWIDQSDSDDYMQEVVENSEDIEVVGIMRPNEEAVTQPTTGAIGYTKGLKEYVMDAVNQSAIVQEQIDNPDTNVFTGLAFPEDQNEEFNFTQLSDEERARMAMLSEEELADLLNTYQENYNATYKANLQRLGSVDPENPTQISLYPKDFESKDELAALIEDYNAQETAAGREENVITYSDLVGTLLNSVTSIINIISYVLIAFVGVSLVVSSIMIGIITYISVLERTKEIGILRSVGASKRDISRVFNAETFIIGLLSGVLGIAITILLNIPISMIIQERTGISGIATLPWEGAVALVLISLALTVLAGLIPSRMASNRDPVEALRSE